MLNAIAIAILVWLLLSTGTLAVLVSAASLLFLLFTIIVTTAAIALVCILPAAILLAILKFVE